MYSRRRSARKPRSYSAKPSGPSRSVYGWYKNKAQKRFQKLWRSPELPIEFRRAMASCQLILGGDASAPTVYCNDGQNNATEYLTIATPTPEPNQSPTTIAFQIGASAIIRMVGIIQPGEFQGLFNEFQISKVEWNIMSESGDSASPYGASSTAGPVTVFWAYDPNDGTTPTDFLAVEKNGNVRSHLLTNNSPLRITHTPKMKLVIGPPDLQGNMFPAKNRDFWLDIDDNTMATPHFCTKFYFRNFGTVGSGCRVRISPILYFKMRRTR